LRRYAGPNDQSILLLARVDATTVFLSGDIEGLAQQELGPVSADVLKVPHHGGGTSDPEWLIESTPKTAVISVGENDYGHPSVWVIEALTAARVELHRTDLEGDIVIDG
jgi:competence protein ComEC